MQGRTAKAVGKRTTHPIEDLMRENKQKWEDLLSRQSKSLEDAVKEYVSRYERLPPKGFDDWYNYCVENDVKIIDDVRRIRERRPRRNSSC
jgi:ribosomal protein S17E